MFNLDTAHVFWTTVSCGVALGRCFISFRRSGINIYIWEGRLELRRFLPDSLSVVPRFRPIPAPFVSAQLFLAALGAKNGAFFQRGMTKRALFEPQACFFTVCIWSPSLSPVLFFLSVNPKPKEMLFLSSQSAVDHNFHWLCCQISGGACSDSEVRISRCSGAGHGQDGREEEHVGKLGGFSQRVQHCVWQSRVVLYEKRGWKLLFYKTSISRSKS